MVLDRERVDTISRESMLGGDVIALVMLETEGAFFFE